MPTQSTTYNSRVTDEALEKRFRDTFRSQGGSELVDDLYAQGVIVPVVDFTAAATGQQLAQNLQTAWDFSTASYFSRNTTTTIANSAGFWRVGFTVVAQDATPTASNARIIMSDGISVKNLFKVEVGLGTTSTFTTFDDNFIVFLRAGDSVSITTSSNNITMDAWVRQIATVTGDLVDPSGFTSS